MLEFVLLVLSINLAVFGWRSIWRQGWLDQARDRLFDQRDHVREMFIAYGVPLSDPLYAALRDHINTQIRFLSKLTLYQIAIGYAQVYDKHKDTIKRRYDEFNARFVTEDERLAVLVEEVRARSYEAVMVYVMRTAIISVSFIGVLSTYHALRNVNLRFWSFWTRFKTEFYHAATGKEVRRRYPRDKIEEYALLER
jgi:hypothetical protein